MKCNIHYLNTRGCYGINAGRFVEAFHDLNRALDLMKILLTEKGDEAELEEDAENQHCNIGFYDFSGSYAVATLDKNPAGPNLGVGGKAAGERRCFEQPLYMNPLNLRDRRDCSNLQLSFVVAYNLALASSLCAMFDCGRYKDTQSQLCRARNLWELVYDMHMEEPDLDSLHSCAILHNLGCIYRALGQYERWKKCMSNLHMATIYLEEETKEMDFHRGMSHAVAFFLNSVERALMESGAAPAA